ncbi:MAG: 6-phosphofructokinase, partial [Phycisphaerae bacterium]|nr:6-phosphofructokinase [Phycisphaerae bacterium]
MSQQRLGIIVGGGPAPGINAVIGAATIEAINRGFEVVGIYDGFRHLVSDNFDPAQHSVRLLIPMVARIHFEGGSILRTSRTNLLDENRLKTSTSVSPDPRKMACVLANLRQLGVTALLTIGGDDTALSARFICDASAGEIRIVHCPKTIDNDLPLPHGAKTFGFATAGYIGTQLTKNLMRDSQTTGRWYFISAMGRTAGWLAQSIAQAAGATVCLIPEEFADHTSIGQLADVLEGAILKRRVRGRPDGVAVVAEGLTYKLGNREELERLLGREVPVDAAGHPQLADVPLVDMLRCEVAQRFKARGEKLRIVLHELGYELRSADPTPYDMSYCRSLGWGSIQLLLHESPTSGAGKMVTLVNENLVPMDFHEMIDPQTNRTCVRTINIDSDNYRVARAYQIRLESSDLEDPDMLAKLAAEAQMTPEDFRTRYA